MCGHISLKGCARISTVCWVTQSLTLRPWDHIPLLYHYRVWWILCGPVAVHTDLFSSPLLLLNGPLCSLNTVQVWRQWLKHTNLLRRRHRRILPPPERQRVQRLCRDHPERSDWLCTSWSHSATARREHHQWSSVRDGAQVWSRRDDLQWTTPQRLPWLRLWEPLHMFWGIQLGHLCQERE